MVVVVGTGTLAGVELAMRGPELEAPVESALETRMVSMPLAMVPLADPLVAPRAELQMTPPNTTIEE
jgi:hypothetical protein